MTEQNFDSVEYLDQLEVNQTVEDDGISGRA